MRMLMLPYLAGHVPDRRQPFLIAGSRPERAIHVRRSSRGNDPAFPPSPSLQSAFTAIHRTPN